ncbi:MAG: DinB family protein [Bacteroidota bacterium]
MKERIISAQDQVQRLNHIVQQVKELEKLDLESLTQKPAPDRWSILEVLGHMNAAYEIYEPRIDQLLAKLPDQAEAVDNFKTGRKTAFFVKAITPKGDDRPMHMKTMKVFYPKFDNDKIEYENKNAEFQTFYNYMNHLKGAIQKARTKANKKAKLNSALGPIVRFHLPEAFEFNLGHMERHLIQIKTDFPAFYELIMTEIK